jgi:16S rRNA (cytosine1402-N4)-methyltransferase
MSHIPVLQNEVLQYLDPKPNENFIDCTVDGGGHATAIMEKNNPGGKLLGIEWDEEVLKETENRVKTEGFKDRLILVNDSFLNLKEIARKNNFNNVSGILFDLGMSGWHLEESKRGFSFLKKEPLDMRYNLSNPLTAEKIVNYWSKPEIERILKDFGEETFYKEIADGIISFRQARPIETTFQLVEIIKGVTPRWYQEKKIHPATKTFQALRIAVNDELNNIEKTLNQTIDVLKDGGRLVVISFHSLEDRIVKNFLKTKTKEGLLKILTKKPIVSSQNEIRINPRSRSAKLRAAIKL